MAATILIVDDDVAYARSIARLVKREGYAAETAQSGEEALDLARDLQPELILVDMTMPGMDGIEVLQRLQEREANSVCLAMSGSATVERAVAAMHAGAFDFVPKTAQLEEIQFKLRKGVEVAELRRSVQFLQEQEQRHFSAEMVGESPAMQQVFEQIKEIAATPVTTVLILGETGTGKELVARGIHQLSERHQRPLVSVNCTAMPGTLMESEFFGYERGAFTGADRTKRGLVELADGGSLFLDEIGDLDLQLQGKLLRVIEERCFKRVGGVRDIEVNVRFMAATNRDMEGMVLQGSFRSDLLYRLNVFQIVLPPLRQREQDTLLLARNFIRQFNAQLNKEVKGLSNDAEKMLLTHPFPGNVRQLRNLIEQAVILSRGSWLTPDHFKGLHSSGPAPGSTVAAVRPGEEPGLPFSQQLQHLKEQQEELLRREHVLLQKAIDHANGNKSHAAELLGISRYALLRRLKRSDSE